MRPGVRVRWNFGDGNSGSGQVVQHVFQTSGPQAVTLTVSAGGVSSSTGRRRRISCRTYGQLLERTGNTCCWSIVTFTSTSTVGAGGTIVRHVWDFGDGSQPFDSGSTSTVTGRAGRRASTT